MTIKPDTCYKTQEGRKVRIYATDGINIRGEPSIHGAIDFDGKWLITTWDLNGHYRGRHGIAAYQHDIVSEWVDEPPAPWKRVEPPFPKERVLKLYADGIVVTGYVGKYSCSKHCTHWAPIPPAK